MMTIRAQPTPQPQTQVSEVPVWMRRAQRRTDWGVLVALAFSLCAAWSWLALPLTPSVEPYLFQTEDMSAALREGRLYPRWSPHALSGYGAPVAHFAPPLAPYLAALIDIFVTDDTPNALRVVLAIATVGSALATYAWVTRHTSAAVGLLASTIYTFSPYIGLTAPHQLGDVPGALAQALVPALLWATDRLLTTHHALDFTLVSVTGAALILTEPRYAAGALVVASVLSVYTAVFEVWQPRRVVWFVLALAGSMGIASFYWLPALLEAGEAQWRAAAETTLLAPRVPDLFMPLARLDANAQADLAQLTIGVSGVISLIAAGVLSFSRHPLRRFAALMLTLTLVALALVVVSGEVRGLAFVSLTSAAGGAAAWELTALWREQSRRIGLAFALVAVLLVTLPVWALPPRPELTTDLSPQGQIAYEQAGYGVAVLPPDAPLPSTLAANYPPNRTLIRSYQTGAIVKLTPDGITGGLRFGILDHTGHSDRFSIQTVDLATVRLLTAYFPGWVASVGLQPIATDRDPDTGLLRLRVPAGTVGELNVAFATTPTREQAWLLAGASLGLVALLSWRRWRRSEDVYSTLRLITPSEARLLALVVCAFAAAIAIGLQTLNPIFFARPGSALDGSIAVRSRTESGLELLAYRLPQRRLRGGEQIDLSLYWRTLRPLSTNYRVRVGLVGLNPPIAYAPTVLGSPGGLPTQRWRVGLYVGDHYRVPIAPDLPAGEYLLAVEAVPCAPACDTDNRLTFFTASGETAGETLLLPTFIEYSP